MVSLPSFACQKPDVPLDQHAAAGNAAHRAQRHDAVGRGGRDHRDGRERDLAALCAREEQSLVGRNQHAAAGEIEHVAHASGVAGARDGELAVRLPRQKQSLGSSDQHGIRQAAHRKHGAGVGIDNGRNADRAAHLARHQHAVPGSDQRAAARQAVDAEHAFGVAVAAHRCDSHLAVRCARQEQSLLGADQHAAGTVAQGSHRAGVGIGGGDTDRARRILRQRRRRRSEQRADDGRAAPRKSANPLRCGCHHMRKHQVPRGFGEGPGSLPAGVNSDRILAQLCAVASLSAWRRESARRAADIRRRTKSTRSPGQTHNKKPAAVSRGGFFVSIIVMRFSFVLGRPGSDLLFQALRLSTIGAGEFNGRVRDGIGYRLPAITTRPAKDG